MKLTRRTKLKEIAHLLTEERIKEILPLVAEFPLKKSLFFCTCGEFCRVMDGDEYFINSEIIGKEKKAVRYFGKLKRLRNEMETINKFMNLNKRKETTEEKQARQGVSFPTAQQMILLVVQKAFYLKSLTEAEKVPFSNYLILHQSQTAESKYQDNYNKIMQRKYENNRRS